MLLRCQLSILTFVARSWTCLPVKTLYAVGEVLFAVRLLRKPEHLRWYIQHSAADIDNRIVINLGQYCRRACSALCRWAESEGAFILNNRGPCRLGSILKADRYHRCCGGIYKDLGIPNETYSRRLVANYLVVYMRQITGDVCDEIASST